MDKYNNTSSNFEKDIIYSETVKAGKRIYYLDVRKTKKDEFYLSITESKKIVPDGDGNQQVSFEKHKIFLYREDFSNFIDGLSKTIRFIQEATVKQEKDREKDSNSREKVISQYVEGIQSILLLGEEFGFKTEWLEDYAHQKVSGELSNHLMQVLEAIVLLRVKKSVVMYKALFMQYLQLGKLLGVEFEEIAEKFNIE